MKRKNVLEVLASARPADLDLARYAGQRPEPGAVWQAGGQVVELGTPSTRRSPRRGPARRRRATWIGAAAASLSTVAVISTVAVPHLWAAPSPRHAIDGPASAGAGPNSGLDAAANRAAEQQTPKAYWHTDASIYGEEVIGSAGNRYRIRTGVQVTQWTPSHPASAWVNSWTGRGPASVRVLIGRDLPTRLASSEDEAAWRREGAPKLCGNDTDCENDINRFGRHGGYATSHLLPLTDTLLPTQGPSLTSTPGISLTSDELLDLPQDPDALKKRLMPFWLTYEKQTARRPPATSITGRSPYTKNSWFWAISVELLRDAPITGGTRAALYRMVEKLPGVRALGRVHDVEGRAGVGIARVRQPIGEGQDEQQLIVSESAGRLLAVQNVVVRPWRKNPYVTEGLVGLPVGAVYLAVVYRQATWTNTPSKWPKSCPQFSSSSLLCFPD